MEKLYEILMPQHVTEENVQLVSSAVGEWLGQNASRMGDECFEALVAVAVAVLKRQAQAHRAMQRAVAAHTEAELTQRLKANLQSAS